MGSLREEITEKHMAQKQRENEQHQITDRPPSIAVLELLHGMWVTRSIHLTTNLRLADLLVGGPKSVQELAEATNTHAPSLYRLLRSLAGVGIFRETEPNTFAQTPLSEVLRSDRPDSLYGLSQLLGQPWQLQPWVQLEYSIRTGKSAFEHVHGMQVWKYMSMHPEMGTIFNQAMTSFSTIVNMPIAQSYDFSAFDTLVDVGGGVGSLLTTILRTYPTLKGILFDLPMVIDQAREQIDPALHDRIQLAEGSFLETIPTGGDAYLLKQVLHDWSKEDCLTILQNCRRAMKTGATLLVADRVLEAEGQENTFNQYFDLHMLVLLSGGERTAEEFREFYEASGFRLTRIVSTGTPISLVEGVAVEQ